MTTIADPRASIPKNATQVVDPIWRLAVKRADPIVALNDGDIGIPIFCVHPISGDVAGLRPLAKRLGRQRFHGIQVPKNKMNGGSATSIEAMAGHYLGLLTAFQGKGPIILAGWSAGAIVALEMARRLRAEGRDVPLLVALDGAPCNTGAGLKPWQPLYLLKLLYNLPRWIRDDTEQDWSPLGVWRRMNLKLATRFGFNATGRVGGTLRNVQTMDAHVVQNLLDANGWTRDQTAFIHAMYKATVDYMPAPYDGRVIAFETKTQPLYHLRQVGDAWRKIAPRTEVVSLEGNHSAIVREPAIGTIASHLLARLDEVRERSE